MSNHLINSIDFDNKNLECPHCGQLIPISIQNVVEAPSSVKSDGCIRIATCPNCKKDSCATRKGKEYSHSEYSA